MPARQLLRQAIRRLLDRRAWGRAPGLPPPEPGIAALPGALTAHAARHPVDRDRAATAIRTLVELTERHGVSDEQLAALLCCAPEEIARRREGALAAIAEEEFEAAPPKPAAPIIERGTKVDACVRVVAAAFMIGLLAGVLYYKSAFIQMISVSPLLSAYGLIVVFYISSRFLFSAFYRPGKDYGLEPQIAIVMPSFNEEAAIGTSLRSLLELNYPADKLQIVAVNDGSTDRTLLEMRKVEAIADGRVRVINFRQNRGKRAAMAAGIRATEAEIVAFVDSDSVLDPDALRILVQRFHHPKVGAVCGHADVLNVRRNWITKMQAVRYFVAFSVNKAAESLFSAVTCCSGCFSAYRREAIMPRLDWWEHQKFVGRPSTFGDDRSLTNCVLRDWKVQYESRAVSHTIVPDNFRQFMRQQLRWKRSWTRESCIVSTIIWKKHPLAALSGYVGTVLPIIAPIVAMHAIVMMPALGGGAPVLYIIGIYVMSVCYGLYYAARKPRYDNLWVFGILFCFFYLAFLLWQTYWAMLTVRTASWGTRPATAGLASDEEPRASKTVQVLS